jgi:serine/threonine protein kinase
LKPANVMLTDRNVCRIIDFGLSVVKESSRMASHDPRIKAGNGTLHYQAPELLEMNTSAKRDHKVDVYAYAVTILELFQQQPPYPSTMPARHIDIMVQRGERPAVDRALVPADIFSLVNLAWHQNKDVRPEFTAIVMGLLGSLQTGTCARANAVAAAAKVSEMASVSGYDLDPDHERKTAARDELAREADEQEKSLLLNHAKQNEEEAAAAAVQREHEREAATQAALAREEKKREKNNGLSVPSKKKRRL